MTKIFLVLFLFSTYAFCQSENVERNFKFFYKSEFKYPRKLELKLVKDNDTLDCSFNNNKIILPKQGIYDLIISFKKNKNYKIENVDFSQIGKFPNVIIGIETEMEHFGIVPNEQNNLYVHLYNAAIFKIDDFNKTNGLCFIIFNIEQKLDSGKLSTKQYTRTAKI